MMQLEIDRENIARIWDQLNKPHRPGRRDGLRTAHHDILKAGWGMNVDIQDILWETDDRADQLCRHNDDFDFLLSPNNLHYVSRYGGPFSGTHTLCGHRAMPVADVAAFIMEIERLGFAVDAEPLVEELRAALLRKKYLTHSEVSIVRYKTERHRWGPIVLHAQNPRPTSASTITTSTSYRATALFEEENIAALRIDPPKYRGWKLTSWVELALTMKDRVPAC
jgi:hypothetical protein